MKGKRKQPTKIPQNDRRQNKRSRPVWGIEVCTDGKVTTQTMKELERFFIKRVCRKEGKLPGMGYTDESQKSMYFEFQSESQEKAALRLNGHRVGSIIRIKRWNQELAPLKQESRSPDNTGASDESATSPTKPLSGILKPAQGRVDELGRKKKLHSLSEVSVESGHSQIEIETKDRLLAAANEHIQVLTEANSKYEKRAADQFSKIEELQAQLKKYQVVEKEQSLEKGQQGRTEGVENVSESRLETLCHEKDAGCRRILKDAERENDDLHARLKKKDKQIEHQSGQCRDIEEGLQRELNGIKRQLKCTSQENDHLMNQLRNIHDQYINNKHVEEKSLLRKDGNDLAQGENVKRKRCRPTYAVVIKNVNTTDQLLSEVEGFFAKRVHSSRKSIHASSMQIKEKSCILLELPSKTTHRAALKLDGSKIGGKKIEVQEWRGDDRQQNSRNEPILAQKRPQQSRREGSDDAKEKDRLIKQIRCSIDQYVRDKDMLESKLKKLQAENNLLRCNSSFDLGGRMSDKVTEGQESDLEHQLGVSQNGATVKREKQESSPTSQQEEQHGGSVRVLEGKLSQALQEQNVLLGDNQSLRREIKDMQQQTISTLESKEEENEQLREEIEQMRMNHAMEMGLVEDSSEEVTSLKEELERAHQRIEELEG